MPMSRTTRRNVPYCQRMEASSDVWSWCQKVEGAPSASGEPSVSTTTCPSARNDAALSGRSVETHWGISAIG